MFSARPPGVFEWDNFAKGTKGVLDAVIQATKKGTVTIIGMLDTISHSVLPSFVISGIVI